MAVTETYMHRDYCPPITNTLYSDRQRRVHKNTKIIGNNLRRNKYYTMQPTLATRWLK